MTMSLDSRLFVVNRLLADAQFYARGPASSGISAWARAKGLRARRVRAFVAGECEAGDKLLDALGLERTVGDAS